jgi:hypothetical protein
MGAGIQAVADTSDGIDDADGGNFIGFRVGRRQVLTSGAAQRVAIQINLVRFLCDLDAVGERLHAFGNLLSGIGNSVLCSARTGE